MEKKDVNDIVATAVSRLQEKYKTQNMEIDLIKLENGYKRFDPQRGMEYMLDLKLRVTVDSGQTGWFLYTFTRSTITGVTK